MWKSATLVLNQKQFVLVCGLCFESLAHFFLEMQNPQPKFLARFFVPHVMYYIIFEKLYIFKIRTCVNILV